MFRSYYLLLLVFLYSCRPATYVQHAVNVPFFDNKHELQATSYFNLKRFEAQTAFSIDSSFGIMGNGYIYNDMLNALDFDDDKRAYSYEIGLGYLTKISNRPFEVFGGFGQGVAYGDLYSYEVLSNYPEGDVDYETNYNKLFLQMNLCTYKDDFSKIGLSLKNNLIHYPSYNYKTIKDVYIDYYDGSHIIAKDSIDHKNLLGAIIDPVLYLSAGNDIFRFTCQIGYSISFLPVKNNIVYTDDYAVYKEGDEKSENFEDKLIRHPKYNRFIFKFGIKLLLNKKP
jgi:hypothetical protein